MQLDDQVAGLNMNQNLLGNADSRDWGIKKKDLPQPGKHAKRS